MAVDMPLSQAEVEDVIRIARQKGLRVHASEGELTNIRGHHEYGPHIKVGKAHI